MDARWTDRDHVARAPRHFSNPSNFSVSNSVSRMPKDMAALTQTDLDEAAQNLNGRPRQTPD